MARRLDLASHLLIAWTLGATACGAPSGAGDTTDAGASRDAPIGQWPSPSSDSGGGDGSGTRDSSSGSSSGSDSGLALAADGIVTVGRVPGGAVLTLTDDGFELDETRCNGSLCLAGGITP